MGTYLYLGNDRRRFDRVMRFLVISLVLVLGGCASTPLDLSKYNPLRKQDNNEVVQADPMQAASSQITQYGVILIGIGVLFAALTRFRTGWGISAALAGVLMILIAWTFEQMWAPWLGLGTIVAYAGYKIWNWGSDKAETENPLL